MRNRAGIGAPAEDEDMPTPYAWASKPASPADYDWFTATDVGANGTVFQYKGSRWRVMNGVAVLLEMGAAVSGITNAGSLIMQTLIPAGVLQANDFFRIELTPTKSGATDAGWITVRVGTTGTTADTAITGLSSFNHMAAAGVAGGAQYDIKIVSSTSFQKVGNNAAASGHAYQAVSGATAAAAATAVSDADANALYLSVYLASSSTNNTVGANSASIILRTP
jgi:hypothetical protein